MAIGKAAVDTSICVTTCIGGYREGDLLNLFNKNSYCILLRRLQASPGGKRKFAIGFAKKQTAFVAGIAVVGSIPRDIAIGDGTLICNAKCGDLGMNHPQILL